MTETPEAVPAPHPAWVGGAEEFLEHVPAAQAAQAWSTATCLNPICRAKNDIWADQAEPVITCWVCGRQTDLSTSTLVPRPEPGPDEEVTPA